MRAASIIRAAAVAAVVLAGAAPVLAAGGSQTQSSQAATVPDATVKKAGAALRDVMKVQQDYEGRIQAAPSTEQKQGLTTQANAEAVQAINSKGISLEEYTNVVQLARTDPSVKQKLLDAAK